MYTPNDSLLVAGAIIQIMALFAMAGLGTASTVTVGSMLDVSKIGSLTFHRIQ